MTRRLVAIACLSAAVVLLQVTLTRILSVVLWYHWAFFSISLAMLGVGAPGVWFSFARRKTALVPWLCAGAAVAVPLGVALIVKGTASFAAHAILYCMVCMLPAALLLGAAVCLLLLGVDGSSPDGSSQATDIGRMYAFDLLGACAGAVAVVPLMSVAATPALAAAVGFLPLAAWALLVPRAGAKAGALAIVLASCLLAERPFELRFNKIYLESGPRLRPIFERWTPTARLTVFDSLFFAAAPDSFHWGRGASFPGGTPPEQYWIEQDGSAGTPITRFRGRWDEVDYLLFDVTTIGHQLARPRRVAIVGAGGGRDILTARLSGAEDIDAIELNPGIFEIVQHRFGDFSGGVYELPGVHPILGEGRSVLTRSRGGYDLIHISLIDSWAATSAGAYALSENNLYTLEAYRLYWSRLGEGGVVSTSRWLGPELARLARLVAAALAAEGVAEPLRHIAVVEAGAVATVLMSRTPFEGDRLRALTRIAGMRGFRVVHPGSTAFAASLFAKPKETPLGMLLDPPTDDRPFFFQSVSPFSRIDPRTLHVFGVNGEAVAALQKLMIAMAITTLLLFFAPFALRGRLLRGPGFWRGSLYFSAIGTSFMLVEIAWLSRFILYLDHPSFATAATLGLVLLGAGLGSMRAARLGLERAGRWLWLASVLIGLVNVGLGPLFAATLGWPLALRLCMAALLLVPIGFVMGLFFPLGMVRFGEGSRPWFWALNGAAGVLASVASLALAIELGFSRVAFVGAAIYALAWWLLRNHLGADDYRIVGLERPEDDAPPSAP